MSLLEQADIDSMRSDAQQALPDTAVIESQVVTDNAGGGGSVSWGAAGTVPCRLAPMSMTERDIADRVASDANYVATLPAGAAVSTSDRLLIGSTSYEILAVRDRGSWELTRRVELNKVD